MRIEAVQNERRPYINPNTKHELLSHVLTNQRLQKSDDPTSLNTVKSIIVLNKSIQFL
jgi:hypothetical protein